MSTHHLIAIAIGILLPPATAMIQKEEPRPRISAESAKGFADKNAVAIASLYWDDAILMPPNEPLIKGRDNIQQWYRKLFESGASSFKFQSERSVYEGPIAYESGSYSVTLSRGDRRLESMTVTRKYLWTLRRSTTGWQIDSHMFNADSGAAPCK